MRNLKEIDTVKRKGIFHAVFYLIVVALYGLSLIGVSMCAMFLLWIMLAKEVHIQNSQEYVLGLIMFYPLLQLKKYMDKEWEFNFKIKK